MPRTPTSPRRPTRAVREAAVSGPSSVPGGERAGTPGAAWQQLVRTETVIPDDAPDPQPNRAERRALARAARRTK